MKRILLVTFCLSLYSPFKIPPGRGQDYEFQREVDTIPVLINGVEVHSLFIARFLNSKPAFGDLDDDGDLDLFVGKDDGSIIFYRNTGNPSEAILALEDENLVDIDVGSQSAPTLVDIDDDGDLDLFVGEIDGNIFFYRNTGTASMPVFVLETENYATIDVGSSSVPTFADIDNDGDFDLFVGENVGNINFYRNIGTASQPSFALETQEFASINVGGLSTPTFADFDQDGDLDLFVGEQRFFIPFPGGGNINFFVNIGTATEPNFIPITEDLSDIDVGADSAPTFADIDDDGDDDLFVGESGGDVHFFRNDGQVSDPNPAFRLITDGFASIDVGKLSIPVFADIDSDGDVDMFVGEDDGNISFYRNFGTTTVPNFSLVSENFGSIDVGNRSALALADIDSDGDLDLFVGENDGNINFYRNEGTASDPSFLLETENFASIDVGGFGDSSPTFVDIDSDGDLDLFVGENVGNINFYRNTGTATDASFTLETESFGSIDAGSISIPSFADIDVDGDFDLIIGNSTGRIQLYRNDGSTTDPSFTLITEKLAAIDVGFGSAPFLVDIDNDSDLDLFIGELDGNIHFYENIGLLSEPILTPITTNYVSMVGAGGQASPTFVDIDNDDDFDLFVAGSFGDIRFYRNTGSTTSPIFTFEDSTFASVQERNEWVVPKFADIDNDSDFDLFVGFKGKIHFYRNVGSASQFSFHRETEEFASVSVDSFGLTIPAFVDIDNDADADLFVGEREGNLNFYLNSGTATEPNYVLQTENFSSIDIGMDSAPTFADIDRDNDFDLFVGRGFPGTIAFYRNTGSALAANFVLESESMGNINVGFHSHPSLVDIDDDGDLDLFVGESSGGVLFYRNVSQSTSVKDNEFAETPRIFALSQNYPNPFNPETTIKYQLPKAADVKLEIYNLLGQRVVTMVDEQQPAGFYSIQWDGKDDAGRNVASGVYLYKLEADKFVEVQKMVLVR